MTSGASGPKLQPVRTPPGLFWSRPAGVAGISTSIRWGELHGHLRKPRYTLTLAEVPPGRTTTAQQLDAFAAAVVSLIQHPRPNSLYLDQSSAATDRTLQRWP